MYHSVWKKAMFFGVLGGFSNCFGANWPEKSYSEDRPGHLWTPDAKPFQISLKTCFSRASISSCNEIDRSRYPRAWRNCALGTQGRRRPSFCATGKNNPFLPYRLQRFMCLWNGWNKFKMISKILYLKVGSRKFSFRINPFQQFWDPLSLNLSLWGFRTLYSFHEMICIFYYITYIRSGASKSRIIYRKPTRAADTAPRPVPFCSIKHSSSDLKIYVKIYPRNDPSANLSSPSLFLFLKIPEYPDPDESLLFDLKII